MSSIFPAATAVLIRETAAGLKTLLLRRNSKSKVGAGAWVFPGGRVEAEDFVTPDDPDRAARRAAVRETFEEAAVTIDENALQFISHWTTPSMAPKRFSTWFFLAEVSDEAVVVDGLEIDLHLWCPPSEALEAHRRRDIELMPPTVLTLTELAGCGSLEEVRAFYSDREPPFYEPRMATVGDAICMLYNGDAGYDSVDASIPGRRCRCWLEEGVWRYECG